MVEDNQRKYVRCFRTILSLGRLCADRHRNPLAAYASYQSLLDANWQQSQQTLEAYNDNMFSNSSWAAMLMCVIKKASLPGQLTDSRTIIYGGIYVAKPTYSNLDLINAMTTDTTSRMINNIWQQHNTYVQFKNLNDDADKIQCRQDTHGPLASRYCADGGVYYLQSLNIEDTVGYPNVEKPYSYDKLSTLPQPIEPWVSLFRTSINPSVTQKLTLYTPSVDLCSLIKGIPAIPHVLRLQRRQCLHRLNRLPHSQHQ